MDAQGNVKVPGLGMTFAPNGDIYGSDGTKLYDGATQRWLNQGGAAPTAPSPAPVSK